MNLRHLLVWSYLLMLFLAAAVPGHRLLGVPVNTGSLALFVLAAAAYIVATAPCVSAGLGLGMACFALAMYVWLAVALGNPQTPAKAMMNEFDGFLATGVIIFGAYFLLEQGLVDMEDVSRAACAGFLFFCAMKVLLITTIVTGVASWGGAIEYLDRFMDYGVISNSITGGFSRFLFPNDVIAPFVIAFLIFHDRFGIRVHPLVRWGGVALAAAAAIFSFSRYLWALSVVGVLIGAVSFRAPRLIVGMIVLGVAFFALNPNAILTWYDLRFRAVDVSDSDQIRLDQLAVLPREIAKRPILGKGFGGSAGELVRNEEHPFDYEVQWLAYLMNFGIVGVGVMLAYFTAILRRLRRSPLPRSRLFLMLLFLSILVGAFTNPYLMSPPFALVVALLVAAAAPLRHAQENASSAAWEPTAPAPDSPSPDRVSGLGDSAAS